MNTNYALKLVNEISLHVELFIKIKLRNSASCWVPLYVYIYIYIYPTEVICISIKNILQAVI